MINLDNFTAGSNRKVLWQCPKNINHKWVATITSRTQGNGCPFCAGKKISADNCLAYLEPELSKQWHPTKNGTLTPNDVTKYSGKIIFWQCDKNINHQWYAKISYRTRVKSCPLCSNKKVCIDNCLNTANPEIAKQWHPTKNYPLTPNDVTCHSDKKIHWICEKGHEWKETVNKRNRHRKSGYGCQYCLNNRTYIEDNCLAILRPDIAKQWHPTKNGTLTPNDIVCGSKKKVWWVCEKGHEYEAVVKSRTRNRGTGCKSCYNTNRTLYVALYNNRLLQSIKNNNE